MGQIFQLKDRPSLKQVHNLDVYRNYKLWVQIENMLVKPLQYIMKMSFLLQNRVILLVGIWWGFLFVLNIIFCH